MTIQIQLGTLEADTAEELAVSWAALDAYHDAKIAGAPEFDAREIAQEAAAAESNRQRRLRAA